MVLTGMHVPGGENVASDASISVQRVYRPSSSQNSGQWGSKKTRRYDSPGMARLSVYKARGSDHATMAWPDMAINLDVGAKGRLA